MSTGIRKLPSGRFQAIVWLPTGNRVTKTFTLKSQASAWRAERLAELARGELTGLAPDAREYTVAHAVGDWLTFGLPKCSAATVNKYETLCRVHVVANLGKAKLHELLASDVDRWLTLKARTLSTSTLAILYQCLNRAVNRAMARGYVARNVVALCGVPAGQAGRVSRSLTFDQAWALLETARTSTLAAYVMLSLQTGARTEELRALRWDHVDLDSIPASMQVWRSVRQGGDTKTRKSRRTLALPAQCVEVLREHRDRQDKQRANGAWRDTGLVFTTSVGTGLDAANVRRAFRRVVAAAGLDPSDWTPRDLRHSFVSLLSAEGMTVEQIADLAGHASTKVTETVYRHELRPVLLDGAVAMDRIFGSPRT